jgi:oligopeptide/dipeptide ABC transporter ATP-binding protein
MQTVFQDPYSSLNTRFTVWQIISEPLYIAGERNERVLRERAAALVEKVGLSLADLDRYVFEFSGGQRQRIAIARALIANAQLIICDEPTSALDVSVHSQICNLLLDLREEFELTYLFISHNLSLIKHITEHMAVMYLGEVMECGSTDEIFASPKTPYTEALMSAILEVNPSKQRERIILSGEARSPINPPDICRFANRCPKVCDTCRTQPLPPMTAVGADHSARCHLIGKEGNTYGK